MFVCTLNFKYKKVAFPAKLQCECCKRNIFAKKVEVFEVKCKRLAEV